MLIHLYSLSPFSQPAKYLFLVSVLLGSRLFSDKTKLIHDILFFYKHRLEKGQHLTCSQCCLYTKWYAIWRWPQTVVN